MIALFLYAGLMILVIAALAVSIARTVNRPASKRPRQRREMDCFHQSQCGKTVLKRW